MTAKDTIAGAFLFSFSVLTLNPSLSEEGRCLIKAANLEQIIARRPELRERANAQTVRDPRTLQETAIVLQSYKYESVCAQVIAVLKRLAADPERTIASGDTDEDRAEALDKVKAPKAAPKEAAQ